MDARKIAFLFGELPPDLHPDDQEVRHRLVRERVFADRPVVDDASPASALIVLQHQSIADQIAADDPPEVWRTAVPIARCRADAELRDGQSVLGLELDIRELVALWWRRRP